MTNDSIRPTIRKEDQNIDGLSFAMSAKVGSVVMGVSYVSVIHCCVPLASGASLRGWGKVFGGEAITTAS